MLFQERQKFILETDLAMMRLLPLDVAPYLANQGLAHPKPSIPTLPGEVGIRRTLRLDPFRRSLLHVLHRFAQGNLAREIEQNMSVIRNRIDQHTRRFQILQHHRHVGMKILPDVIAENRLTILRAENKVDVVPGQRLGHERV